MRAAALLAAALALASARGGAASARRDARARARWGADVIAVVGWHGEDLAWLTRLPLGESLRLAVLVKRPGDDCAALPVPPQHVALCERAFNADGRDAHTALSFISEHYELLPRVMLFLHGDAPQHPGLDTWLDGAYRPEYVAALESTPVGTAPQCGCAVVREDFFRACTSAALLPPGATPCYRYYEPITVLLELLFDVRLPNETITWVTAGQLAVSSRDVRRHARASYRVALALLNGTTSDPFWRMPSDAPLVLQSRGPLAPKHWTSLELAHAFERAWLAIWAPSQRPLRRSALLAAGGDGDASYAGDGATATSGT